METHTISLLMFVGFALVACGSEDDSTNEASSLTADENEAPQPASPDPGFANCTRGTLESDFMAPPLEGAAISDGRLRPGQYVVSSTYLQLKPDAATEQLFGELVAPIIEDLQARPGLLALSLGGAESCGIVRTLSVWQDDAAMIAFVGSPAHASAMSRVDDLSRGASVVTHWLGDESEANWASAASHLAADEGPLY